MSKIRLILLLISLSTFIGCHHDIPASMKEALEKAQDCMEAYPDSALQLLEGIQNPEILYGKAQADYALLYTQACDKNSILTTNDSLIQIAVDYYGSKNENINAAKSYFYLGCIYSNSHQDEVAVKAFLKALEKMPHNKANKLWMQLYFNLGERYFNQGLYNASMEMRRKCLQATRELNDSSLLFFPYRGIASTYLLIEKSDSALIYYQKALDISRQIHNSYWETVILNDMGKTYLFKGDTIKANQLITDAIGKMSLASSFRLKSELLFYRNELDSAKQYLLETCCSNDLYAKSYNYNLLYKIERKKQNHAAAYAYNDSFNIYRDSIEQEKRINEIQTLNIKNALDLQKKEIENKQEKIYWITSLIMAILALGGIGFYQFLKKRHKEELLKQERINFNDQTYTMKNYMEEKLGEEISFEETTSIFKKERLQRGILSFQSSIWKEKLEKAEKEITSGEYMKQEEQQQLYQDLDKHFNEFIADLAQIYPEMHKEDSYYCILSSLKFRSRTLVYCMRASGGTLRTRKSRIKKNMAEETFNLIFEN